MWSPMKSEFKTNFKFFTCQVKFINDCIKISSEQLGHPKKLESVMILPLDVLAVFPHDAAYSKRKGNI